MADKTSPIADEALADFRAAATALTESADTELGGLLALYGQEFEKVYATLARIEQQIPTSDGA